MAVSIVGVVIHNAKVSKLDVAVNEGYSVESLEALEDLVEGFEMELEWLHEEGFSKFKMCEWGLNLVEPVWGGP
jgi:hypothetical protein